jgi:nucleotide-binding universal stress UspA family protein
MKDDNKVFNRNILIAVDDSDNARRAVSYVAQLLGSVKGFKVSLLHVIPQPEEDFFPTSAEKEKWLREYKAMVDAMLEDYGQILIREGFEPDDLSLRSTLRYCPSIAECILLESGKTDYDTIVVGRKGRSRSEEFLFGSISNKIVSHARNCTVWVVE